MFRTGLEGPSDPRWIGAWWLGFLGSGILALIATLPMFGFARELPEAKKHRLKDVDQVHAVSYVEEDDEILSGHLKHLPKAIWVYSPIFSYLFTHGQSFSEHSAKSYFCRLYGC